MPTEVNSELIDVVITAIGIKKPSIIETVRRFSFAKQDQLATILAIPDEEVIICLQHIINCYLINMADIVSYCHVHAWDNFNKAVYSLHQEWISNHNTDKLQEYSAVVADLYFPKNILSQLSLAKAHKVSILQRCFKQAILNNTVAQLHEFVSNGWCKSWRQSQQWCIAWQLALCSIDNWDYFADRLFSKDDVCSEIISYICSERNDDMFITSIFDKSIERNFTRDKCSLDEIADIDHYFMATFPGFNSAWAAVLQKHSELLLRKISAELAANFSELLLSSYGNYQHQQILDAALTDYISNEQIAVILAAFFAEANDLFAANLFILSEIISWNNNWHPRVHDNFNYHLGLAEKQQQRWFRQLSKFLNQEIKKHDQDGRLKYLSLLLAVSISFRQYLYNDNYMSLSAVKIALITHINSQDNLVVVITDSIRHIIYYPLPNSDVNFQDLLASIQEAAGSSMVFSNAVNIILAELNIGAREVNQQIIIALEYAAQEQFATEVSERVAEFISEYNGSCSLGCLPYFRRLFRNKNRARMVSELRSISESGLATTNELIRLLIKQRDEMLSNRQFGIRGPEGSSWYRGIRRLYADFTKNDDFNNVKASDFDNIAAKGAACIELMRYEKHRWRKGSKGTF